MLYLLVIVRYNNQPTLAIKFLLFKMEHTLDLFPLLKLQLILL